MSDFVERVRDRYLVKRNGGEKREWRLELPHEWLDEVFEAIKKGKVRAYPESDQGELRQILKEVILLQNNSQSDWNNLWAALFFMLCVPTVSLELQKLVSEIDETLCEDRHTRDTVWSLKKAIANLHPLP